MGLILGFRRASWTVVLYVQSVHLDPYSALDRESLRSAALSRDGTFLDDLG
jgi:hypothetical protein